MATAAFFHVDGTNREIHHPATGAEIVGMGAKLGRINGLDCYESVKLAIPRGVLVVGNEKFHKPVAMAISEGRDFRVVILCTRKDVEKYGEVLVGDPFRGTLRYEPVCA